MRVNVIRRQPSLVSVQRRFHPRRRHQVDVLHQLRGLQPPEPALCHHQHLPDHRYRPVHSLKPLRRISAQPQRRKGRLHNCDEAIGTPLEKDCAGGILLQKSRNRPRFGAHMGLLEQLAQENHNAYDKTDLGTTYTRPQAGQ